MLHECVVVKNFISRTFYGLGIFLVLIKKTKNDESLYYKWYENTNNHVILCICYLGGPLSCRRRRCDGERRNHK